MKNKTVLITDGNIDIGLATARLLGADGTKDIVVQRNLETLAAAKRSLVLNS